MATEYESKREAARTKEHAAAVRDGYVQAALTGLLMSMSHYDAATLVIRANEVADLAMKTRKIHFTPGSAPL